MAIFHQLCCNRDRIAEFMRYSLLVPVWLLCLAAGVAALFVRRSRRVSIGFAAPIRLWLRIALMTLTACCGCTGSHNTASQTVRSQGTASQNASSESFETRFPFHQQTTYFDFRLQSESPQNAKDHPIVGQLCGYREARFLQCRSGLSNPSFHLSG